MSQRIRREHEFPIQFASQNADTPLTKKSFHLVNLKTFLSLLPVIMKDFVIG